MLLVSKPLRMVMEGAERAGRAAGTLCFRSGVKAAPDGVVKELVDKWTAFTKAAIARTEG